MQQFVLVLTNLAGIALLGTGAWLAFQKRGAAGVPLLLVGLLILFFMRPDNPPPGKVSIKLPGAEATMEFQKVPLASIPQKADAEKEVVKDAFERTGTQGPTVGFENLRKRTYLSSIEQLGLFPVQFGHAVALGDIVKIGEQGHLMVLISGADAFGKFDVRESETAVPEVKVSEANEATAQSFSMMCNNPTLREVSALSLRESVQRQTIARLLSDETFVVSRILRCGSLSIRTTGGAITLDNIDVGVGLIEAQLATQ